MHGMCHMHGRLLEGRLVCVVAQVDVMKTRGTGGGACCKMGKSLCCAQPREKYVLCYVSPIIWATSVVCVFVNLRACGA